MSATPSTEFFDLIARASEGETAAFDEIARLYESKVRVVARVLLGPALRPYLDSGDLAQSVHKSILVGLHESKFQVEGPDHLVALALTVLRRKVAKKWRHMQRQRRLSGDGSEPTNDLPGVLAAMGGSGNDPADIAQLHDQMEHLCSHLDETEQTILNLRLEGHTPAEIAELIGISRVALRVRLTRLRHRLRDNGVLSDWL